MIPVVEAGACEPAALDASATQDTDSSDTPKSSTARSKPYVDPYKCSYEHMPDASQHSRVTHTSQAGGDRTAPYLVSE